MGYILLAQVFGVSSLADGDEASISMQGAQDSLHGGGTHIGEDMADVGFREWGEGI